MAITSLTIEQVFDQIGGSRWEATATSDVAGATFYWWVGGWEAGRNLSGVLPIDVPDGEYPVVEVFDDPDALPAGRPGTVRLGWEAVTPASAGASPEVRHWDVEEWVDPDWVFRQRVPNVGQVFVTWESGWLADGYGYRFRVVPVGTNGETGEAREYGGTVRRHPDPPDVGMTYGELAGTVTVAAN